METIIVKQYIDEFKTQSTCIPLDKILSIEELEYDENFIQIHLITGKTILVEETLDDFFTRVKNI